MACQKFLQVCATYIILAGAVQTNGHPADPQNAFEEFENSIEYEEDVDTDGHFGSRGIDSAPHKLWPDGIVPFMFTKSLNGNDQHEVRRAQATYQRFTCLRFVPWTIDQNNQTTNRRLGLAHSGYLRHIKAPDDGCFSYVGLLRAFKNGQNISCCGGTTCVHEIGHALGLHHEQKTSDPDRLWSLRINPEKILPDKKSQYQPPVPAGEELLIGGYDISSVMHYEAWTFAKVYNKPTMTKLFPEQIDRRDNVYYAMMAAAVKHECHKTYCSHVAMTCENDGFMTLVDGVCKCQCVDGLNPDTGCTTPMNSETTTQAWPGGSHALPKPAVGCADVSARTGNRTQYTLFTAGTKELSLDVEISGGKISQGFCVTQGPNNTDVWPAGVYCIYRKGGQCPEGFTESSAQFDDAPEGATLNTHSGVLPDGEFGSNTRIYYCCKDDGFKQIPIFLPTSKPFSLINYKAVDTCQKVRGMHVKKEYFTIKNSNDENVSSTEGSHPLTVTTKRFTTTFCSYRPTNMECGGVHELSRDNPTVQLSSPQGADLECYWLIKAPEGQTLRLQFDNFNIACTPGNCQDELGVRYFKLGQPPHTFCGDRFDRTIQSVYNTIMVSLKTYGDTHSEFTATATVTLDEDLCYLATDRGTTYSGNVNFTRFFEPCLPWADMGECEYSLQNHIRNGGSDTLDGNYCRNPDYETGIKPWCYMSRNCDRNYCDPCLFGQRYDTRDGCASLKTEGLCTEGGMNVYQCARTCNITLPEKPPKATEVTCGDLPGQIDGGQASYSVGSMATCMSGEGTLHESLCLTSGEWSYTCKTRACGTPPDIEDGELINGGLTSYSVGSKVTYKCNIHDGQRDRTCLSNGQWSPLKSVCDDVNATCGNPPGMEGGDLVDGGSAPYSVGSEVTYNCNTRSYGQRSRYCLSNGEWSPLKSVCDYIAECPDGWTLVHNFGKKCYKLSSQRMTLADAHEQCKSLGAEMFAPVNWWFLKKVFGKFETNNNRIWLPWTDEEEEGIWKTKDGKIYDWFNGRGEYVRRSDRHCMAVSGSSRLYDVQCHHRRLRGKFICVQPHIDAVCDIEAPTANVDLLTTNTVNNQLWFGQLVRYDCKEGYVPGSGDKLRACSYGNTITGTPLECVEESPACEDSYAACPDIFRRTPRICSENIFATEVCRYTCGDCERDSFCNIEVPPANTVLLTSDTRVQRGHVVEYKCKDGHVPVSGDSVRACAAGNNLSGTQLKCQEDCPNGTWYLKSTKSCYKYFHSRDVHSTVSGHCEQIGCFLATPKTQEESDIVLQASSNKYYIWIGLRKIQNRYVWQDGESLLGRTNWNGSPTGDCVFMLYNGKWYDGSCRILLPYVCQCPLGILKA